MGNRKTNIRSIKSVPPPPNKYSDHEGIICELKWHNTLLKKVYTREIWNFNKTNFEKYKELFVYFEYSSHVPNIMLSELLDSIHKNAKLHIKKKI